MPVLAAALGIAGVLQGETPEQAVREAQRQWIDSYNHRDERALNAIEGDDFRITFGDGQIQTKADQLVHLRKPLPQGAAYEIAVESSEVRVYGAAAVVTGVVMERGRLSVAQGSRPFNQRSRYTDTWVLQNGKWRVVASHLSELKD